MTVRTPSAQTHLEQGKKGFTLTEIAIVLGIMGLILGAIWVAAAGVYNNHRVNTASTAVATIVNNVRKLYGANMSTGAAAAADATAMMVSARVIPNNLISGAATSGPFTSGTTGVALNGDGFGFVVIMTNVPKSSCINLLTTLGGTGRDPGLYSAVGTSDATTLFTAADAIAATPTPLAAAITAATVGALCPGAYNRVRLGYILR